MTSINHITIHVPYGTLSDASLIDEFMALIGFAELEPQEKAEGLVIRWFEPRGQINEYPLLHLVEGRVKDGEITHAVYNDLPALGHFCITTHREHYEHMRQSGKWLERDSGSGRIWLRFANIRIEVRPNA